VDEERIWLLAMDRSHIALVGFELPQGKLIYYLAPCIGV